MSEPLYEEKYKVTKVCIDGYKDKVLEGRIYQYNSEFEEGICFHSTMEFLNCMEYIMKTAHFPEYQECRSFQPTEEAVITQSSPETVRRGQMATFVVRILFRQHAS